MSLHVRLRFECSAHVTAYRRAAARRKWQSAQWIYDGIARKMSGPYRIYAYIKKRTGLLYSVQTKGK